MAVGRRNLSLDGVRAVAVLGVILFHVGVVRAGFLGVDVFFVLSGFLITGVLIGERRERGSVSMRRFYARRALRLYPALLVMLVVLTPLGPGLGGSWWGWARGATIAGTYTSDLLPYFSGHATATWLNVLGPTWSLAVEEQFYLLWPLSLLLLLRRGIPQRALAGALAALAALLLFPLPVLTGGSYYFRPDFRFGDLLLGCAIGLLLAAGPARADERVRRAAALLAPLGIALIAGALASLDGFHPTASYAAWSLAVGLGATAVIADVVLAPEGWASRVLRVAPLPLLGRWSYGIYLWNFPVITVLEPRLRARGVDHTSIVLIVLACNIAVAAASHRIVELPFLRLKARLRSTPVAGLGGRPEQVVPAVAATPIPQPASPVGRG